MWPVRTRAIAPPAESSFPRRRKACGSTLRRHKNTEKYKPETKTNETVKLPPPIKPRAESITVPRDFLAWCGHAFCSFPHIPGDSRDRLAVREDLEAADSTLIVFHASCAVVHLVLGWSLVAYPRSSVGVEHSPRGGVMVPRASTGWKGLGAGGRAASRGSLALAAAVTLAQQGQVRVLFPSPA